MTAIAIQPNTFPNPSLPQSPTFYDKVKDKFEDVKKAWQESTDPNLTTQIEAAYNAEGLRYESRFAWAGPFQGIVSGYKRTMAFADYRLVTFLDKASNGRINLKNERGFSGFRLESTRDYGESAGRALLSASGLSVLYAAYQVGNAAHKIWINRQSIHQAVQHYLANRRAGNGNSRFNLAQEFLKRNGKEVSAGAVIAAIGSMLQPSFAMAVGLSLGAITENIKRNSAVNGLTPESRKSYEKLDAILIGTRAVAVGVGLSHIPGTIEHIQNWANHNDISLDRLVAATATKAYAAGDDVSDTIEPQQKIQRQINSGTSTSNLIKPQIADISSNRTGAIVPEIQVEAPTSFSEYTVQKGDTLNKIAWEFGFKNYKDFIEYNPQFAGNPDLIRPGQVVKIPHFEDILIQPAVAGETINIQPAAVEASNTLNIQPLEASQVDSVQVLPQTTIIPGSSTISLDIQPAGLSDSSAYQINPNADLNIEPIKPPSDYIAPLEYIQPASEQVGVTIDQSSNITNTPDLQIQPAEVSQIQQPAFPIADIVPAVVGDEGNVVIAPQNQPVTLPASGILPAVSTEPILPAPNTPIDLPQLNQPQSSIGIIPANPFTNNTGPVEQSIPQPANPSSNHVVDTLNPKPQGTIDNTVNTPATNTETQPNPSQANIGTQPQANTQIESNPAPIEINQPQPDPVQAEINILNTNINGIISAPRGSGFNSDNPGFWSEKGELTVHRENIPASVEAYIAPQFRDSIELIPQDGRKDSCFVFALNNALTNNSNSSGYTAHDPAFLGELILSKVIGDPGFKAYVASKGYTNVDDLFLRDTPGKISILADQALQFMHGQEGVNILSDLNYRYEIVERQNFNVDLMGATFGPANPIDQISRYSQQALKEGGNVLIDMDVFLRDGKPAQHYFSVVGFKPGNPDILIVSEANRWQERNSDIPGMTLLEKYLNPNDTTGNFNKFDATEVNGSQNLLELPLNEKNLAQINKIIKLSPNN